MSHVGSVPIKNTEDCLEQQSRFKIAGVHVLRLTLILAVVKLVVANCVLAACGLAVLLSALNVNSELGARAVSMATHIAYMQGGLAPHGTFQGGGPVRQQTSKVIPSGTVEPQRPTSSSLESEIDDIGNGYATQKLSRDPNFYGQAPIGLDAVGLVFGLELVICVCLIYGVSKRRRSLMVPHLFMTGMSLVTSCFRFVSLALTQQHGAALAELVRINITAVLFYVPLVCFKYLAAYEARRQAAAWSRRAWGLDAADPVGGGRNRRQSLPHPYHNPGSRAGGSAFGDWESGLAGGPWPQGLLSGMLRPPPQYDQLSIHQQQQQAHVLQRSSGVPGGASQAPGCSNEIDMNRNPPPDYDTALRLARAEAQAKRIRMDAQGGDLDPLGVAPLDPNVQNMTSGGAHPQNCVTIQNETIAENADTVSNPPPYDDDNTQNTSGVLGIDTSEGIETQDTQNPGNVQCTDVAGDYVPRNDQ